MQNLQKTNMEDLTCGSPFIITFGNHLLYPSFSFPTDSIAGDFNMLSIVQFLRRLRRNFHLTSPLFGKKRLRVVNSSHPVDGKKSFIS